MSKKEPLTLDMVKEKSMSAIDIVQYFKPDWGKEECDFYLWEYTCYPFSTSVMVRHLNKRFLNYEEPIEPPTKL